MCGSVHGAKNQSYAKQRWFVKSTKTIWTGWRGGSSTELALKALACVKASRNSMPFWVQGSNKADTATSRLDNDGYT